MPPLYQSEPPCVCPARHWVFFLSSQQVYMCSSRCSLWTAIPTLHLICFGLADGRGKGESLLLCCAKNCSLGTVGPR